MAQDLSTCVMNLSLIDPFVLAQDYPDTLSEKLSARFSSTLNYPALTFSQGVGTRHACASIVRGIIWRPDELVFGLQQAQG